MSIPGLDWGMDEVMGKDTKKVPQKKVPYAKPIPAQFQQVNMLLSSDGHLDLYHTLRFGDVLSLYRPGQRIKYP